MSSGRTGAVSLHESLLASLLLVATLFAAGCAAPSPSSAPTAGLRSGIDRTGADPATRPQDDLYRAVNGRWMDTTELPPDRARIGTFLSLRDASDRQVRDLVEALPAGASPDNEVGKVGAFYRGYVDTAGLDRAGLASLHAVLAQVGAIDGPEALVQWWGRTQDVYGSPAGIAVRPGLDDPGVYTAYLGQDGLGLPDREYYLGGDARFAAARTAYLTYLETLFRLAGDADAAGAARDVFELERKIAESHRDRAANRDVLKRNNPMSVAELSGKAPGVPWTALFDAAGLPAVARGEAAVVVMQPETMTTLARLLGEVPLATWLRYARARVLDASADVLTADFRAAHFALHGATLTGLASQRPRWERGVAAVNGALGQAVGKLYVARHFPPEQQARMRVLVDNLLKAYAQSIDGLTWMSPATRAQAQAKLAKMVPKIGAPERWRDYGALEVRADDAFGNRIRAARFDFARDARRLGQRVDRTEWFTPPQTVNAFYSPQRNEIVFPAGILHPPFFDPAADDAVNYGAIGAVIGHEISHGFDDQGSRFDGEGRLRSWWTDADRQAFEALGARLVAQFDAYEPLPGRHVNGRLTLGENIADLSGLQVAWRAWQLALGGRPAPVIDGLTGEQRFFVGFAQVWRSKLRPELQLQYLAADTHAPAALRANGTAINHDGFHAAFDTHPGDRMYKAPGERIRIW